MEQPHYALIDKLNKVLDQAQSHALSFKEVLEILAGKGQAILLIIFSIPFCQPLSIPGASSLFGIILSFIGLRIAFGHHIWLPASLLEKKISLTLLKRIASLAIGITHALRFIISTRIVWLVQSPSLHLMHGITIAFLGILLALPLPIPFTNMLAAWPIFLFGLALLEEDGALIIVAYLLAFLALLFFMTLAWLGTEGIAVLFNHKNLFSWIQN